MIFAEAIQVTSEQALVGLLVIGGGMVLRVGLDALKFWKTAHGDPERRAVNILAEHATKDEVKALGAEIRELKAEVKLDRVAAARATDEQTRVLTKDIQHVLSAVSELRGAVDVIRDKTTRT